MFWAWLYVAEFLVIFETYRISVFFTSQSHGPVSFGLCNFRRARIVILWWLNRDTPRPHTNTTNDEAGETTHP
jgi:hypothetical protein